MSENQPLGEVDVEVRPSGNQSGFPAAAEAVGGDGDFQKDIQAIAKEQGLHIGNDGNAVPMDSGGAPSSESPEATLTTPQTDTPPSQPDTEEVQAEDKGVAVPKKFQDAEGRLDQARLDKSMAHVQSALEKYAELEKELKRKQNEVKRPELPDGVEPGFDGFAKQIEDTIRNEGTGAALAKLFQAAQDSALQQMRQEVSHLAERTEIQERKSELQRIAEEDPQVLTQEGYDILAKVRSENPHINTAPNPWTQAYYLAKGMGYLNSSKPHAGQVAPIPTPKGAPVTPPSGARREEVRPSVDPNSQNLSQLLDNLTPEQEAEFWKKQGFPSMRRMV